MTTEIRPVKKLLGLLACLLLLPAWAHAQAGGGADLNISPKRLVFSGASRSAVVYVFNRGTESASYSIEFVDRVMLPDGQIVAVAEATTNADAPASIAALKSAKEMLNFTPRRVTLGPGESQIIRVRLLAPAGLAAGEYRSHMTVSTLPSEDVGVTAEQLANVNDGQLAVKVVSLLSLSIPVIVRQEVGAGKPALAQLAVAPNPGHASDQPAAFLTLSLLRSGAGSVYGNIEVLAQKAGGKAEAVGGIKGVAVYPEIDHRAVQVPLGREVHAGEHLMVRFVEDDEGGKANVLADASLDVR